MRCAATTGDAAWPAKPFRSRSTGRFRTLGLHRVEADIDPRNMPSRRLLGRLGFASEGLLRERFFIGDEATDSEIFGLLADDWRQRRPR